LSSHGILTLIPSPQGRGRPDCQPAGCWEEERRDGVCTMSALKPPVRPPSTPDTPVPVPTKPEAPAPKHPGHGFSFRRFGAVLYKEFIQMRRARITFGMMIGLPLIQLFLFGFAINADPHHLPTLVEMGDNGPLTRAVIAGMQQSDYFDFRGEVMGTAAGEEALRQGTANFVVVIPQNFE